MATATTATKATKAAAETPEKTEHVWREGFGGFGDAKKLQAELLRIAKKVGKPYSAVTADEVLEHVRNRKLYPEWHRVAFTLDDSHAAICWRLDRVRAVIRWLGYRAVGKPESPIRISWTSVADPESGERFYAPVPVVVREERLRNLLLKAALAGIHAWQKRYAEIRDAPHDPLVAEAFADIQRGIEKLSKAIDRAQPATAAAP